MNGRAANGHLVAQQARRRQQMYSGFVAPVLDDLQSLHLKRVLADYST